MKSVDTAIDANDYTTLQTLFATDNSHLGQGEKRSLAAHLIHAAVSHSSFLPAAFAYIEDVFIQALEHLPATVTNAADSTCRQLLFDYRLANDTDDADYAGAARILAGMRMDDDINSVYYTSAADKLNVYVKIAECFLQQDEIVEADSAVQKAGTVAQRVSHDDNKGLLLRYKSTYARILDANRKFLAAASRYHELSQSAQDLVDADDLLVLLGRAATCAILAPSGPQRQRILAHVYKDERLHMLDRLEGMATHSLILKKM
jgi:COP9 signalosome complex subunit 4